jgi:tRNA(Ile)-lysidine synthase
MHEFARQTGLSTEEAGREYRYHVFDEAAKKCEGSSVRIVTAHHADDQAETILMRILRGTGGAGLSGIAYSRWSEEGVHIIRPMLDLSKDEIYEYCKICDLHYSEDETNMQADVFRNKIRLELIPYLEKNYNENIRAALARLAKSAAADNDFLASYALSQSGDYESLQKMPDAIFYRFVVQKFAEIGLDRDIEMVHVEALRNVIRKNVGNKICEFPHGFVAEIKDKKVRFKSGHDTITSHA